jgi:hypothetical protein
MKVYKRNVWSCIGCPNKDKLIPFCAAYNKGFGRMIKDENGIPEWCELDDE